MILNVNPSVHKPSHSDAVNGASGWVDAAVLIPYKLWKRYGDDRFITDNYEMMHKWSTYMMALAADKSMFELEEDNPVYYIFHPSAMSESSGANMYRRRVSIGENGASRISPLGRTEIRSKPS